MHVSTIDLNLMVVFDTIYAESGIRRAGQRLNLSQPAISHALGRLRDMFDDPLFIRRGHVMTPTPLARQIIEPIRRSLQAIELTLTKADRFDPAAAKKHFFVAVRDAMEPALLADLMRKICAGAPHVDISVVRLDRRDTERELSAGTVDLAIDVLLPLPEDIRRQRLGAEPLTVVARRGNPKVNRKLDIARYLELEHIAVSSRRRGLSIADFELGRHNLRRRIRLRCLNYFAACRVVSETDLVVTMPGRYARILNAHFDNRLSPFPLETPAFDSYLYWHANADDDPANRWFREQVRQVLENEKPSRQRGALQGKMPRGVARP
ncbi:MAG TPA: LysR family transcriptional regulator [Steroidobacteraceae bacterium]|jgi:DNA-binding transcriptional LysR family regulator